MVAFCAYRGGVTHYDREADILYLELRPAKVARSVEHGWGGLVDLGNDGQLVGVEYWEASRHLPAALLDTLPSARGDVSNQDAQHGMPAPPKKVSPEEAAAARRYWTKERMSNAKPLPFPTSGRASRPPSTPDHGSEPDPR